MNTRSPDRKNLSQAAMMLDYNISNNSNRKGVNLQESSGGKLSDAAKSHQKSVDSTSLLPSKKIKRKPEDMVDSWRGRNINM